jgi:hypothetical protein
MKGSLAVALAHEVDQLPSLFDHDTVLAIVMSPGGVKEIELTMYEVEDGVFDTLASIEANKVDSDLIHSLLHSANKTLPNVDYCLYVRCDSVKWRREAHRPCGIRLAPDSGRLEGLDICAHSMSTFNKQGLPFSFASAYGAALLGRIFARPEPLVGNFEILSLSLGIPPELVCIFVSFQRLTRAARHQHVE